MYPYNFKHKTDHTPLELVIIKLNQCIDSFLHFNNIFKNDIDVLSNSQYGDYYEVRTKEGIITITKSPFGEICEFCCKHLQVGIKCDIDQTEGGTFIFRLHDYCVLPFNFTLRLSQLSKTYILVRVASFLDHNSDIFELPLDIIHHISILGIKSITPIF